MITSLSALLLSDVLFKKDSNNNYELSNENELIFDDINGIMDRIADDIDGSLELITLRKPFFEQCAVSIDYIALKQVITKYSRDVFGHNRLLAILKKVPNYKPNHNKMKLYGMKINSYNPYIHRRAGCFMYWCCALKPFRILPHNKEIIQREDKYIINCFNEVTAYNLVRMMLDSCSILQYCNYAECEHKKKGLEDDDCVLAINIDDDNEFFKDFLYDAHIRSLSRSSFELFMSRFCIMPHCKKGACPLASDYNLRKGNLKFIDKFGQAPSC